MAYGASSTGRVRSEPTLRRRSTKRRRPPVSPYTPPTRSPVLTYAHRPRRYGMPSTDRAHVSLGRGGTKTSRGRWHSCTGSEG
eukprot:3453270-Rhodomonas_salina.4